MADWLGVRRKVFVAHCHRDDAEVIRFVEHWVERKKVFIPRIVNSGYGTDIADSDDTEYVIGRIRRDYLADSTVTLLLLGECTHSRRYIDWELKASLRQGDVYSPNGLLAVSLPSAPRRLHLPPRFEDNYPEDGAGYARWYGPPPDAASLGAWIEEAYAARSQRDHLIRNAQDRLRRNRKCMVHDVVH